MGKKSRRRQQTGPKKPKRAAIPYVDRPFEGLPGETDWVAMREIIPAATAAARLTPEHGGEDVTVVTMLPDMWPAMRRSDGALLVALQTAGGSGDASRDIAAALLMAKDAEPGEPVANLGHLEPGPRLQDVLDADVPFDVTVAADFEFWLSADEERTPQEREAIEQSSEGIVETAPVAGVTSAYWCRMGREFLRWSRPEPQEEMLDAIARLHARRESALEEGTKFVGAFRSSGILIPVWELAPGTEADELTDTCAAFEKKLEAAVAQDEPLSAEERRARAGIVSRQVTLR